MKNNFLLINGEWDSLSPFKIEKIVDSVSGLEIFVSGTRGSSISGIFTFESYYGYRNFDEGDLWQRWNEIGVLSSGLYGAKESELIYWAAKQSVYNEIPEGIINYLFVSIDDVLDVLSFDAPQFSFT